MKNLILFEDINEDSFPLVGGKGYNLGLMVKQGFPVPQGFCIPTTVYAYYKGKYDAIENAILDDDFVEEFKKEIAAIDSGGSYAVRSSATAEDLPDMSFAGQQDTYLNIRGIGDLLLHVKKCWASLYNDRAVTYREQHGLRNEEPLIAVVVQLMVNAEKAGVMFTANPMNNNYNELTINACFGLGEKLVSGQVNPDFYVYNKLSGSIIEKKTFDNVLTDEEVFTLSKMGTYISFSYVQVMMDAIKPLGASMLETETLKVTAEFNDVNYQFMN